jgi:hypothetical protein
MAASSPSTRMIYIARYQRLVAQKKGRLSYQVFDSFVFGLAVRKPLEDDVATRDVMIDRTSRTKLKHPDATPRTG